MRALRPYILVQTNPQEINKGQPLTISARLYNRNTNQPEPVRKIYLNIISEKDGHTVWPVEVVRVDDWRFDILIGTNEMKEGHTYLVRVSNNRNLSPMGATTFKIVKDKQVPIALFPIPLPEIVPEDDLKKREILKFIFRTQMDARVCPRCKEHENEEFFPDEEIPLIPIHYNCRCTYDVVYDESFEARFQEIQAVYKAAIAAKIFKTLPIIEAVS